MYRRDVFRFNEKLEPNAAGILVFLYSCLIVYASLHPFRGWVYIGLKPWDFFDAPWPRYWAKWDIWLNLAGYIPLGFWLFLWLGKAFSRLCFSRLVFLCIAASFLGTLLSFLMECLQTFLPTRVTSLADIVFNAAGSFVGALLAFCFVIFGIVARWDLFCARYFVSGAKVELVLAGLWAFGLIFPLTVPFGVGYVFDFLRFFSFEEFAPQSVFVILGTSSGLLMPCLLGFSIILSVRRRLIWAFVFIFLGVFMSSASSALTHGAQNFLAWSDAGGQGILKSTWTGVFLAGLVCFFMILLPRKVCQLFLLLVIIFHALLLASWQGGQYYEIALHNWENGRFIHLHGLAKWVGYIWPFAVFIYVSKQLFFGKFRFYKWMINE